MTRRRQKTRKVRGRGMIRALTILAAIVALAVSAAPASASDEWRKAPPKPRGFIETGTTEILDLKAKAAAKRRGTGKVANHTEGSVSIWNNGDGHDLKLLSADHNI